LPYRFDLLENDLSPLNVCHIGGTHPDHFAQSTEPLDQLAHGHRQILAEVMATAGFQQHPNEWWHFSLGDQLWAWQLNQQQSRHVTARYGAT
jgi:D-alanyl-D-alanine dipeptidase